MLNKHIIKILIFLIFMSSCSLDEDLQIDNTRIEQRRLQPFEIPEVINELNKQLGIGLESDRGVRVDSKSNGLLASLKIDWSEIVEVRDQNGSVNYTFGIIDTDNGPYVFHNLIIGKTVEGKFNRPYILTYIMNEEFKNVYDNTGSINHFRGEVIKRHFSGKSFGNFGNQANLLPVDSRGSVNNNDPCNNSTNIGNGNSGSTLSFPTPDGDGPGSGGGGSGGQPLIPDGHCYSYWYYPDDDQFGIDENGDPIIIGSKPVLRWKCEFGGSTSSGTPCPDSDDIVAVIDPNFYRPCKGNPVKNPEIAPTAAGKKGGTFGMTRKKCVDKACSSTVDKFHDGIDVKADPGTPIFPIYGGQIVAMRTSFHPGKQVEGSYGNYITIQTTLSNGTVIQIQYSHLQSVSDLQIGNNISTSFPIGTSGITGNAGGNVVPHLHILARKLANGVWKTENPANHVLTQVFEDGSTFTPLPCQPA